MSDGKIIISGKHGGCYFPICELDIQKLRERGFGQEFMLRYMGQRDQLDVAPSDPEIFTPQSDSPEQDLNSSTEGSPARTTLSDVENITIFFAVGQ